MKGAILYGPPASGKDTVTRALTEFDRQYRLFPRIKVGPGRTSGYRMASEADANEVISRGDLIWENSRYESRYLIDRSGLTDHLQRFITVIHLGQVDGIEAVTNAIPDADWIIVSLWCPRNVAIARIRERMTGDEESRVAAWDETEPLGIADLRIDTSETTPENAALQIVEKIRKAVIQK